MQRRGGGSGVVLPEQQKQASHADTTATQLVVNTSVHGSCNWRRWRTSGHRVFAKHLAAEPAEVRSAGSKNSRWLSFVHGVHVLQRFVLNAPTAVVQRGQTLLFRVGAMTCFSSAVVLWVAATSWPKALRQRCVRAQNSVTYVSLSCRSLSLSTAGKRGYVGHRLRLPLAVSPEHMM